MRPSLSTLGHTAKPLALRRCTHQGALLPGHQSGHVQAWAQGIRQQKQKASSSARVFLLCRGLRTARFSPDGRAGLVDNSGTWLVLAGLAAAGIGGIALTGYFYGSRVSTASPYSSIVTQRLRQTYGYFAGGLAITALSSLYSFHYGAARRIVAMNPWLFLGLSAMGSIGSMIAMSSLPKENKIARHVAWGVFNLCNGLALSPIGFLGGPVVLKAMAATGCVVGSLSLIAATAPSESFLWMSAPLGIGLGVVLAASIGQMFFPASAFLTSITLYGGSGLFGLFVLYDTQKILILAKENENYDPMTQSLAIYLDTLNIFIRIATIISGRESHNRHKR